MNKLTAWMLFVLGLIVLAACAGEHNQDAVWAESDFMPRGLYAQEYDYEYYGEYYEEYTQETPAPMTSPSPEVSPYPYYPYYEYYCEYYIECETELMNVIPICPELGRRPMIALTFDDGPGPLTLYVVQMLAEHGGVATFCVIGNRVEGRSDVVLQTFQAGNEIIGHSWNHQNLSNLREEAIAAQILDTSAAIEAVTGVPPSPLFRAPYGMVSSRVRRVSRELGYSILNWTIDPEDWRYRDADILHARIMEQARDGAIVLLHDIHPSTVTAMERVIPDLIAQGFQLVTATYLINYFYGGLEPGEEYRGLRPGETSRNDR